MDTTPIAGVDELDVHLDELIEQAHLPLNDKLFDDVQLQLTESNVPPLIPRLLPKLISILHQDARDPAVPADLATKLLSAMPFPLALGVASEESLIGALRSPAPSLNTLALAVLETATTSPEYVARLADSRRLVSELIHRWLVSPIALVGLRARRLLGDLLDVDCVLPPPPAGVGLEPYKLRSQPGHGAMWRLVFRDRDTYRLLLELASGRHPDTAVGDQLALAQSRLLDLLFRLAVIDFHAITTSDIPVGRPVHATNGWHDAAPNGSPQTQRSEGLLQFAALRMVDRRDELMHLNLIEFFTGFVAVMRLTERSPYKSETIRSLLREATADDDALDQALRSLPDQAVPEEADDLRLWLREVLPEASVRISGASV